MVPEATQYKYDVMELTALMLKDRGIRTGTWMIMTTFSFGVTNLEGQGNPLGPAAFTVLTNVGLQQTKGGSLAVDAADVWRSGTEKAPPKARKAKPKARRKAKAR